MRLRIFRGDTSSVKLTAIDEVTGRAVNLTGWTLTTYLPLANGTQLTLANDQHTQLNQVQFPGQYDVALVNQQASDLNNLKLGLGLPIATKAVNGTQVMWFKAYILDIDDPSTLV